MTKANLAQPRALVLACPGKNQGFLRPYAQACARQLREQGVAVDLAEGKEIDRIHLFKARTVVVLARGDGPLTSKVEGLPLQQAFTAAGGSGGRKAYALLLQRGLFSQRALLRFMKILESEGLLLLDSAVVHSMNSMKVQLRTWQFPS